MTIVILSIVGVAVAMALMSVGLIIRGRSFKASCSSRGVMDKDGMPKGCDSCACGSQEKTPPEKS